MSYAESYQQARREPDQFWLKQAQSLAWYKNPSIGFATDEDGNDRWFPDGELNTSYLALDVHVEQGRGDQTALIYDSPMTGTVEHIRYSDLLDQVQRCAGLLAQQGVQKGDRVVIYMPMIPQAVVAMLACARLGAVHSVVFGGFAAKELAVRIEDASPKVVLSATCGLEVGKTINYQPLLREALALAEHQPEQVIVWERPEQPLTEAGLLRWQTLLDSAEPADCVAVKATDPLYILYTSGTTGKPKGVVRDNGGHAVAMRYSMSALYDVQPGDVYWAASDVGWVVGHSYIVYAPLITGCTTVLYEGKPVGTPDAGAFWRVVEQHQVKVLFAAPTAFRAIKKIDPEGEFIQKYNIESLRTIFMAGERLDPPTLEWTEQKTGKPVVDHWWQTETGWAIAGNPVGLEQFETRAGSACMPLPGFNVEILDADGRVQPPDTQGFIALQRPLPPGCLTTIWNNQARFESGYLRQFVGYYVSGDGGYKDADGYLYVMGRIDDVINVAGHRLSTGEMEAVIGAHPAVAECAVIGIRDELKGQLPLGLVVLKDGVYVDDDELSTELTQRVREEIGAIACYRQTVIVNRLPKTRSGKILRATLRKMADNETYTVPSTIDDPSALDEIQPLLTSNA
ncbi:propionyl-CoA synthetase [Reinekea blandensis]|uniref:PrpE protein n=1 Tax=Reinekea blandensis MED297 TaxID=314283 RepID=A4BK14_9GAMM|nr:propionyl-CoA synthetase [Reinekea blandensis]EAR07547.1 prpE protein [Reinekea sp. MED297] [Reinekea blandensis MED297]